MHAKPSARTHTVTPHCGSHCHQLHVYLTLQFLRHRIADGFYSAFPRPTAEGCVAECVKNASHATSPCTGVIWKAANASGLSACGAVGSTCCYFVSAASRVETSNCGGACATAWQWKSWSCVGLRLAPPSPSSSRRLANPQRLWRNPDLAHSYFSSAVSEGTGPELVWRLQLGC